MHVIGAASKVSHDGTRFTSNQFTCSHIPRF
ncbi:Uncharacterised protein [Vibrio cholerae]|nr:Uncharacterised protein [Vibrio cholerae]